MLEGSLTPKGTLRVAKVHAEVTRFDYMVPGRGFKAWLFAAWHRLQGLVMWRKAWLYGAKPYFT